jgi:hypothetical protein
MAKNTPATNNNSQLTKILPTLLPIIALIIVVILAFRWYQLKTSQVVNIPELPPKIEIESLNPEEQTRLQNLAKGIGDYQTIKLTPAAGVVGQGEIRYEIQADRLYASIITSLAPPQASESYQVWLKVNDDADWQSSAPLIENKAGFTSTFALTTDKLPVAVKVTHEGVVSPASPAPAQTILFQGIIPAPTTSVTP